MYFFMCPARYASFDYEVGPMREADLVLMELLINGHAVDALARMVYSGDAQRIGRALCSKLKELVDRQQFEVVIQVSTARCLTVMEGVQVQHLLLTDVASASHAIARDTPCCYGCQYDIRPQGILKLYRICC